MRAASRLFSTPAPPVQHEINAFPYFQGSGSNNSFEPPIRMLTHGGSVSGNGKPGALRP
jgi:hypothetical protein